MSSHSLNTVRDGDFTPSLDSLFQCLTNPSTEKFFLMSYPDLHWQSLMLCPLILLLFTYEKKPTPTLLLPPFRQLQRACPRLNFTPPFLASPPPLPPWAVQRGMQNELWLVQNSSWLGFPSPPRAFTLIQSGFFPQPAVLQDKPAPARVLCRGSRWFRVNTCSRTGTPWCTKRVRRTYYSIDTTWDKETQRVSSGNIHTFPSPQGFCSVFSFLTHIFMDALPTLLTGSLCPVHSSHLSHPHRAPFHNQNFATYTKHIHMPQHATFDLQKSFWSLFFENFPLWNCLWKGFELNKDSAHIANTSFKALFFSRYPL